jgi:hypothetical protein
MRKVSIAMSRETTYMSIDIFTISNLIRLLSCPGRLYHVLDNCYHVHVYLYHVQEYFHNVQRLLLCQYIRLSYPGILLPSAEVYLPCHRSNRSVLGNFNHVHSMFKDTFTIGDIYHDLRYFHHVQRGFTMTFETCTMSVGTFTTSHDASTMSRVTCIMSRMTFNMSTYTFTMSWVTFAMSMDTFTMSWQTYISYIMFVPIWTRSTQPFGRLYWTTQNGTIVRVPNHISSSHSPNECL